jgi:hypothetical protein
MVRSVGSRKYASYGLHVYTTAVIATKAMMFMQLSVVAVIHAL